MKNFTAETRRRRDFDEERKGTETICPALSGFLGQCLLCVSASLRFIGFEMSFTVPANLKPGLTN